MARGRAQRVGIWVIAIAMLVGTLASFLALILAPKNEAIDQARINELTTQYQNEYAAYQEQVNAQAATLSSEYFARFSQYGSRVAPFDAAAVTELKIEDLVIGTGADITAQTSFSAYYIGWNPSGTVFEQSIEGQSLKAPLAVAPGSVIAGWSEGVIGMKVGGVRELTIPSDLAYGQTGSGDSIPPNTPLKFVMMIIPNSEAISQPEIPEELLKYYQRERS